MTRSILTALLFTVNFARAAKHTPLGGDACRAGVLRRADFEPAEGLRDSLPELAASVHLVIAGQASCSGAYVSDDGEILTASHCLDLCPKDECDVEINGRMTRVRVQLRARCTLNQEEREIVAHHLQPADWPKPKCQGMSDVAVIKPIVMPAEAACLPMAKDYREGDSVHTMGYPSATGRGRADSNGTGVYLSYGKILAPTATCLMQRNGSWGEWLVGQNQPGARIPLDPYAGPGGIYNAYKIQTTVDAVKGNSGGPLVNTAGEITAVTSVVVPYQHDNDKECAGSTFFAPLRLADPAKESADPGFDFAKIKCDKRRAKAKSVPL